METKATLQKRAADYERKLYGLLIEHKTTHEEAVAVAHQAGSAYFDGLVKGYELGHKDAREVLLRNKFNDLKNEQGVLSAILETGKVVNEIMIKAHMI